MSNNEIFSVSEINNHLKNIVESNIPYLYVEGEIKNCSHHSSGHIYFSLSDEKSIIRAVFFKQYNINLDFIPKNGDKVICFGKLSVYERGGSYQLTVQSVNFSGDGYLQQNIEKLKKKLSKLGYFDEKRKKKIPKYPSNVGVITSLSGAAIEDIKSVVKRRYPTKLHLYPAIVQGEKAEKNIINGINYFNRSDYVDLILITRGGGSQEDLACFNSEKIAKTAFESKLPIISAVGHEIDFTILDFVADLRAPTPSSAAEIITADKSELKTLFKQLGDSLKKSVSVNLNSLIYHLDKSYIKLQNFSPSSKIESYKLELSNLNEKFNRAIERLLITKKETLKNLEIKVESFYPKNIFKKGYSVVLKKNKTIFSCKEVKKGDNLEIVFRDGKIEVLVL